MVVIPSCFKSVLNSLSGLFEANIAKSPPHAPSDLTAPLKSGKRCFATTGFLSIEDKICSCSFISSISSFSLDISQNSTASSEIRSISFCVGITDCLYRSISILLFCLFPRYAKRQ